MSAIRISPNELPDSVTANYYICLGRTYHDLADYTKDEVFYYSTLYLSDAQGASLAQWYGVERGMNP